MRIEDLPDGMEGLLVSEDELVCPMCGGEIGVACVLTESEDEPFRCMCEDTDHYGLCSCDIWMCKSCGYIMNE